jgi:hypothetical protein
MRFPPKPGLAGLICFMLIGGMLVSADRTPRGILQAAASETPGVTSTPATPTQALATPTPSPATPTEAPLTPTAPPAAPRRTATPVPLPPPGEIGSTDGIITWGVLMVTVILAALLWHRPDWVRKRPPDNPTERT